MSDDDGAKTECLLPVSQTLHLIFFTEGLAWVLPATSPCQRDRVPGWKSHSQEVSVFESEP